MKRTLFSIALLSLMLLAAMAAAAQPGPPGTDDERQQRLRERIEMMRIWKLTELLNLDEDRATTFFPRYRSYMAEMDSLQQREQRLTNAIADAVESGEGDFANLLARAEEVQLAKTRRQMEFIESSGDLLEPREQAALLLFEHRFHQRLRDMAHDVMREMGPPPGRGMGHGRGRGPGGP